MNLKELKTDLALKQKKGLPFICASVAIWMLITIVIYLKLPLYWTNMLVFCCSCPLLPLSWMIAKALKVNIFDKSNPLGNLGFLFTLNQLIYLLIVMWVFYTVPEKMVMVYAMVFGAHLLPYSWLYQSNAYKVFAILIPIAALFSGSRFPTIILSSGMILMELLFCIILTIELHSYRK